MEISDAHTSLPRYYHVDLVQQNLNVRSFSVFTTQDRNGAHFGMAYDSGSGPTPSGLFRAYIVIEIVQSSLKTHKNEAARLSSQ